tara:strand:- start:71 stop:622 length:552 start_codon:yes stop_codon:yes gene_type:complete
MVVDLFLVYQFVRRLATPFEKWDAFEQGVIDKDGKVLIKRKKFTTKAQTKSWGVFDIMIANLKKLLAKVPGGSSRLASYAAALYLIKEHQHFTDESLLSEDMSDEEINKSLSLFSDSYVNYIMMAEAVNPKNEILDEEPANNVGSGNIAGMDGGHMSKAQQKTWTAKNKSKKKTLKDMMKDNT